MLSKAELAGDHSEDVLLYCAREPVVSVSSTGSEELAISACTSRYTQTATPKMHVLWRHQVRPPHLSPRPQLLLRTPAASNSVRLVRRSPLCLLDPAVSELAAGIRTERTFAPLEPSATSCSARFAPRPIGRRGDPLRRLPIVSSAPASSAREVSDATDWARVEEGCIRLGPALARSLVSVI